MKYIKKFPPNKKKKIARSLGRMSISTLPVLLDVLNCDEKNKISEVIDAIGFLVFYNQNCDTRKVFEAIVNTMSRYSDDKVIFWKCTLCLSAFNFQDSIDILNRIIIDDNPELIKSEAKRSLKLIRGNYGL
ncbi:MAG: hypothetical protein Q8942_18550 [Bacillota bacterium]|nr:hypothetical protein [Bacillota bacterium]